MLLCCKILPLVYALHRENKFKFEITVRELKTRLKMMCKVFNNKIFIFIFNYDYIITMNEIYSSNHFRTLLK